MKDGHGNAGNELRMLVAMPKIRENSDIFLNHENETFNQVLAEAKPITIDNDNLYEIIFENYIMYQNRNESYSSWDDYEIRKGDYFLLFEKSRLLEQLETFTDCCRFEDGTYYPGEWKHYGVYTQNHIIDIISDCEPIIRKRNAQEPSKEYN